MGEGGAAAGRLTGVACPGGVATLEVGSGDGGGEGGEHVKIVADEGGVEVGEEGVALARARSWVAA